MNDVNELEKLRTKALLFTIILIVVFVLFGITIISVNGVAQLFIMIIILIVFMLISNSLNKKYKKSFKDFFVKSALSKILTNMEYQPDYGLSRDLIRGTNLLNTGDVFASNDYIRGTYKGVDLEFSDIHIQERRSTGKSTHYVTTFRGSWMIFSFNKKFKSNVRVIEKGFYGALGNGIFGGNSYEDVSMEDMEFNKLFHTQAFNELDAFYIMTPHMMQKIKDLTAKNKGKMMFGFIDNNLHIANSSGKDSFEPSIFKKINEEKVVNIINSQIIEITQFVEDLDLDNNLFK